MSKLTRRDFLKLAGAGIGGTVVACSGITFVATREPDIAMPQNTFGGNAKMTGKVLVAYATKSGSTVQVAETIGKSLADKGATVDVRPIKSITSLDGYHAVVIGSGVRIGKWLPEAVEFVKKNQAKLNQLPIAFFTVHLLNLDDSEASKQGRQLYAADARTSVNPRIEGFFAGKMEYAKLSWLERWMAQTMKAQEQDLRDWNKISTWAQSLVPSVIQI